MDLTAQAVERSIPRLFITVKETIPLNGTERRFRLHFLCDSKNNIHQTAHDGYIIKKPRQFFTKYGQYLRDLIRIVDGDVFIDGYLVRELKPIASSISIPDICCNGTLWMARNTVVSTNTHNVLKHQDTVTVSPFNSPCISLTEHDLAELPSLLHDFNAPKRSPGYLKFMFDEDGRVRWVCLLHTNAVLYGKNEDELVEKINNLNGEYDYDDYSAVFNGDRSLLEPERLCEIINVGLKINNLVINDCVMRNISFLRLLKAIKQSFVQNLTLSNVTVIGQKPIQVITSLIKVLSQKRNFLALYVINTHLPIDAAEHILKNETNIFVIFQPDINSYIQVVPALDYDWKPLPNISVDHVASSRELRVHQIQLNSDLLKAMSRGIHVNHLLVGLSFKKVDFERHCEESFVIFARALRTNASIAWLTLEECKISNKNMIYLLKMLEENRSLRSLVIVRQKLSLNVIEALRDLLLNTSITSLNLAHNQLSVDHVRIIANACNLTLKLESLDISHNNIGIEGLKSICEMLKHNKTIKIIELSEKEFSERNLVLIARMIKENRTLNNIFLFGECNGSEQAEHLLEAIQQNDVLKRVHLSIYGWSDDAKVKFSQDDRIVFEQKEKKI